MAALDFPSSPTVNQTYTANGRSWQWDGVSWRSADLAIYLALTGGTLTGNLGFASGARITGDFSNATIANRVLVQTSTANASTVFGVIPNGTAVNAQLHVWGNSDPTNAPLGTLTVNSTSVRLQSTASGTGTVLPLTFWQGAAEAARFDVTTSNFLLGQTTGNSIDKLQVAGSGYFATGHRDVTVGDNGIANLVSTTALAADKGGSLSFSGVYATNGGITRFAAIGGFKENATDNAYGGYLAFFSRANGGQLLERGRVSPAGNWLIGTTTDNGANKVQINGSVLATSFSGNGASLTSLNAGNLSGTIPSAVLGSSTQYIGTTAVTLNRASASQTLTGVSIDGNAATATSATSATNSTNAANLVATNWTVTESAGVLYFKYGGVNKAKIDSSGNLTVTGNVTGYGTV